jgi:hypothetical protein
VLRIALSKESDRGLRHDAMMACVSQMGLMPATETKYRYQPSSRCPKTFSGRTRSLTIFRMASIGTAKIARGTPHIQNQNTSEQDHECGVQGEASRKEQCFTRSANPARRARQQKPLASLTRFFTKRPLRC